MPRLNEAQRHEAIGMLRAMPVIDVANHFNCHRATIHKLKSRYQTTGNVGDLPRTGRPRVTTDAEDRRIRNSHLRNRFKTASSTAREWQRGDVSRQTISRRLKDYGLFCRRPAKKSRLTDRHKRTRLAWATRYRRYTQQQWANVIFSDESSFPIEKCDKRKRVYRRVNERFADGCIQSVDDKRSVMV